jgi:hypothetical protein
MSKPKPKYDRIRAAYEAATQRAGLIRALYVVSVATNGDRSRVLEEFYQAVGDVLEGTALQKLKLQLIDKNKVKDETQWLAEKKT